MNRKQFCELAQFFADVEINESFDPRTKSATVEYSYRGKHFKVGPLYYWQEELRWPRGSTKRQLVLNYKKMDWPKGYNNLDEIIDEMVKRSSDDSHEFRDFLDKLQDNIKKIPGMEHLALWPNILNNNHWHDVANMIKFCISEPEQARKIVADSDDVYKTLPFCRLVNRWVPKNLLKSGGPEREAFTGQYQMIKTLIDDAQKYGRTGPDVGGIMKNLRLQLESNKQIVLTGPPGTGKTYLAKKVADELVGRHSGHDRTRDDFRCGFVQFHPSYDYTDFVEGLRPVKDIKMEASGGLAFGLQNGVFKAFCRRAGVVERILAREPGPADSCNAPGSFPPIFS